jgi:hypothetical protein
MTFVAQLEEKHCFVACGKDKVNTGLCDCINRMKLQPNEKQSEPELPPCDVCGSTDVIEAPHMGRNCNFCNPIF